MATGEGPSGSGTCDHTRPMYTQPAARSMVMKYRVGRIKQYQSSLSLQTNPEVSICSNAAIISQVKPAGVQDGLSTDQGVVPIEDGTQLNELTFFRNLWNTVFLRYSAAGVGCEASAVGDVASDGIGWKVYVIVDKQYPVACCHPEPRVSGGALSRLIQHDGAKRKICKLLKVTQVLRRLGRLINDDDLAWRQGLVSKI